jgi:hypothetical protein
MQTFPNVSETFPNDDSETSCPRTFPKKPFRVTPLRGFFGNVETSWHAAEGANFSTTFPNGRPSCGGYTASRATAGQGRPTRGNPEA